MSVAVVEPLRQTLGMRVSVTLVHPVWKTSLLTGPSPVNGPNPCYYIQSDILNFKIDI